MSDLGELASLGLFIALAGAVWVRVWDACRTELARDRRLAKADRLLRGAR